MRLQQITFACRLTTNHVRLETYSPGIGMDWTEALAIALALGKVRPGVGGYWAQRAAWNARGKL